MTELDPNVTIPLSVYLKLLKDEKEVSRLWQEVKTKASKPASIDIALSTPDFNPELRKLKSTFEHIVTDIFPRIIAGHGNSDETKSMVINCLAVYAGIDIGEKND